MEYYPSRLQESELMSIRMANPKDASDMWTILQLVIATGNALPFTKSFGWDTFQAHWFGTQAAYVYCRDSKIIGMYKIGANFPDLGSHVASATYIVSPSAQNRGVGRALVEHSLVNARNGGYMSMQFNYVVSTNEAAVMLYRKMGFEIVGTLPKAFQHPQLGLVDAYVMSRFL